MSKFPERQQAIERGNHALLPSRQKSIDNTFILTTIQRPFF
jgi:hypothetical protein